MSQEEGPPAPPPPRSSPPYPILESPDITAALAHIDALKARVDDAKDARPELWPAVFAKLKILWTADSNAIEGSSLSFGDTKFFLETGLTVQGKPLKDFLDAKNHHDAINMLFELAGSERSITEGAIRELNALLLRGVTSAPTINRAGQRIEKAINPGAYKREPNTVLLPDGSIHLYLEPILVPEHMGRLVTWLQAGSHATHAALAAAAAHYEFVRIHPFDDGNGRGARILMNLILIERGYPPCVIRREDRAAYLDALQKADAGDHQPFARFILESLAQTLEAMAADFTNT